MIAEIKNKHLMNSARKTYADALRKGVIKRPDKCELCGAYGKIHGHHPDYSEPLRVFWVCPACHRSIHAGNLEYSFRVRALDEAKSRIILNRILNDEYQDQSPSFEQTFEDALKEIWKLP